MSNSAQYPCCKVTMELYGRWHTALCDATEQYHEQSDSHFMPILNILKQVVQGDPINKRKISTTSTSDVNGLPATGLTNSFASYPLSLEIEVQDTDKESEISTICKKKSNNGHGSQDASIILGLSATGLSSTYIPGLHNENTKYKSYTLDEYTYIDNPDTSTLGLSAAGLNAPFDPTGSDDLELLRVRTRSALSCLRRHILPASRTRQNIH